MNTTTVSAEIAEFAQQVRAELADLSADDLDDLTDGLEADLAESLEEDPTRELPDPVAYAIELRTAAGLPPEQSPGRGLRGAMRGMTSGLRSTREQVAASLRNHPMTAGMLGFLESVRPAWWVLRAWVAYQLLALFFGSEGPVLPYEAGWWVVLLVLIVMSVQWGRGRWRSVPGLTPLIILGNVVAAVALLPLFAATNAWSAPFEQEPNYEESPEYASLMMNGKPVSNIYVYGPDGKPLSGVQLFDQDGGPLDLPRDPVFDASPEDSSDELHPEPARLETGESAWNVYPRTLVPMTYNEMGELVRVRPDVQQAQKPPFVKVPKVELPEKAEQ